MRHVVLFFFFFNDTATTEIYTLSLHDALPISAFPVIQILWIATGRPLKPLDLRCLLKRCKNESMPPRGSGRRSEEHTSELQSRQYLVCRLLLEKKNNLACTSNHHLTITTTIYS